MNNRFYENSAKSGDICGAHVMIEHFAEQGDYVNSSYRNYEEDNTVFCNVNVKPLW